MTRLPGDLVRSVAHLAHPGLQKELLAETGGVMGGLDSGRWSSRGGKRCVEDVPASCCVWLAWGRGGSVPVRR